MSRTIEAMPEETLNADKPDFYLPHVRFYGYMNSLNILILCLFVIDLALGVTSVTGVLVERSNLILKAVLQFTIVIIGYLIIFGNHAILKRPFTIKAKHQPIFAALLLWTSISICSGFIGIYAGNDISYVVGDLYKFLMFPGVFILFYYAIKSLEQIKFILYQIVVIYNVFILCHLVLIFTGLISRASFITPVPALTLEILPLLIYTILMGKKALRFLGWFSIFGIFIITLFSNQSVGFILNVLFAPLIFSIVKSNNPFKMVRTILILLIFIVLPFYLFKSSLFSSLKQHILIQSEILGNRLAYKAKRILEPLPILEKIEIIAAGRLSEIGTIITNTPEKIISGSGMGSFLTTRELLPEWRAWSENVSHSMHSGFGEVLYRAGIGGLIVLLYLVIVFIKKSLFYRKIHPYAILSSAFGIQLFANYIIGGTLTSGYLMFCLLFVGVLILEKEYKKNCNKEV